MKHITTDTPGGRLRDIRLSQKKTIQEFAEHLGITGNYLGLIERGDRKPSQALFKQFADTLGISFDWLMNGDAEQDTKSVYQGLRNQFQNVNPIDDINPKLFLTLVVMYAEVAPNTLADILTVPINVVNQVSQISDIEILPDWADTFPTLARQINIAALRYDLSNIEALLRNEENKKIKRYVHQLIARLKEDENYAKIFEDTKIELPDLQAYTETCVSMDLYMPITVINTKRGVPVLRFHCYLRLNDTDADTVQDMYDVAKADTINSDCGVFIIVKSSDVYSKFDELNTELRDKFDMKDAGLSELGYPVPYMPDITTIYFDDKTGEYDALPMYEDVEEDS